MARQRKIHLDAGGVAACGAEGVDLTADLALVASPRFCKNCLRSPRAPEDLRLKRSRPSGDKVWVPAGACDAIALLVASYKGDRVLWNKVVEVIYGK